MQAPDGLKPGDPQGIREFSQLGHRCCPNPPLRHINDSVKAEVVMWVVQKPQISQSVLDFLASIELKSPYYLVGHIGPQEGFF